MSRVATSKICGNTAMRSLTGVLGHRLEVLTTRALSQRLTTAAFSTTSLRASGQQNIWPKKGGAPPRAGVPYSPATKAGGFIFISGQTSVLENGNYLPVDSSVSEKTHRMCQNARAILEGAGSSTDKVVNVKVYFTNIDRDYDEFNKVYAEYFPHNPSRTSVEVTGLPKPADLEIDVIALA